MSRNSRIIRQKAGQAVSRLPLIGNVRIGEKRKNSQGKEYPVSLDYFIATGDYATKFNEAYPDKSTKIQIVFISDDDFQSCFEEWDGRNKEGRRAGYGDGETFHLWNGKEYAPETDLAKMRSYSDKNGVTWKQVLTLHFIIPAIRGIYGCWKFQTSGDKSSMVAIRTMFDEIKSQAGTVVNIPFDLTVKKVKGNKPGDKSIYPVVNLVPNISTENMEQLRQFMNAGMDMKKIGMLTEEKLAALPHKSDDPETMTVTEVKAHEAETVKITARVEDALAECCVCGKTFDAKTMFHQDGKEYCQARDCQAKIPTPVEPPPGTLFEVDKTKPDNSFDN